MVGAFRSIFTHRSAGGGWGLASVGLATALALTSVRAQRREDFLRGRLAALASRDASQAHAELVSCRAGLRSYEDAVSAASTRPVRRADPATRVAGAGHDAASVAAQLTDES